MIPKFPLFLTLLVGGLFAWLWGTDHTFRAASVILLLPLWLLLLGLWWALHLRGVRLQRLGLFVVGVIAIVAGFRYCVRYEGSADGSAPSQPGLALAAAAGTAGAAQHRRCRHDCGSRPRWRGGHARASSEPKAMACCRNRTGRRIGRRTRHARSGASRWERAGRGLLSRAAGPSPRSSEARRNA